MRFRPGGGAIQLLVILASTALLWRLAGELLPEHGPWVGHDYSYFFPYLVAGANWVRLHGWIPPHFTPDFCGGLPWLGNPQSVFYSLPQLIATTATPVAAARWTLVVSATIGAATTWGVLRRAVRASPEACALGFVLFQVNGFLLFRMAVGHLAFHLFALAPMIALLTLMPVTSRRSEIRLVALAALAIAAIIFGGGGGLLLPILAAVAAVIALVQLRQGATPAPWVRLLGATLWSAPLAALKLVPALMLVGRFPRSVGPALIASPLGYITQLGRSLFMPETLQPFTTVGTLSLNQHEFEYGVSIVPALLLMILVVRWLRAPHRPAHLLPASVLMVIGAAVTAVSFGSMRWAALLQHVPIVASTSVGTRWWIVWVLALIVATPLALDTLISSPGRRVAVMMACSAVVMLQSGVRSLTRYTMPTTFSVYDPAAAAAAMSRPLPAISVIARPVIEQRSDGVTPWAANDGVFTGTSDVPCYEPLFDHDLHLFPATWLKPGPVFTADAINLADPRCYYAGANECSPGSPFAATEADAARRFAAHESLDWVMPWRLRVSEWMTAGSMILTLLVLFAASIPRPLRNN